MEYEDYYKEGTRFVALVSELHNEGMERGYFEVHPFTCSSFDLAKEWSTKAEQDYAEGKDVDVFGCELSKHMSDGFLDILVVPVEAFFHECYEVTHVGQEF